MTQSIEQINQNLWESLAYDMKFNMELWYLGEIQGYNILAKFYINMSDEKIVRSSVEDRLQLGEVHTYEELLDSVAGQCGAADLQGTGAGDISGKTAAGIL